jgi:hypothetical protein
MNYYMLCRNYPEADDPEWATVVGSVYSLDGTKVVLRYPAGVRPTDDAVRRLRGLVYTQRNILSVLSRPGWSRDNVDARLFEFLRPSKRWEDLVSLNWDDARSTLVGPVERIDTTGMGDHAGEVVTRMVYGPGQTALDPIYETRRALQGELPFAEESHVWDDGVLGPARVVRTILLRATDGSVFQRVTSTTEFSLLEGERQAALQRERAWEALRRDLIGAAIGAAAEKADVDAALLSPEGRAARDAFVASADAQGLIDYLDSNPTPGMDRAELVERWLARWGAV